MPGALVVYWLVINGLAALLGLAYEIAFVVGTAASFAWSLLTNFFWVWARPARVASSEKASGITEHKDATSAIGDHQRAVGADGGGGPDRRLGVVVEDQSPERSRRAR